MNENVHPSLQPFLRPIPYEEIGKTRKRASELERDRAAIELAAYVVGLLKFDHEKRLVDFKDELLRRANKVRVSQGDGAILFVTETAERIRAAAEPGFTKAAFADLESELSRQMAEPAFDGDMIGAP